MTHQFQNIQDHHAGDALDIICTVEDESGNTIDISSANEIQWVLKNDETDPDTEAVLDKTLTGGDIAITDGPNGEFTVTINTDETTGNTGTLHHRARLTDADGDRSTIFTGTFEIIV